MKVIIILRVTLVAMQAQQDDVGTFADIKQNLTQSMLTCNKGGSQVGFCFSGGAPEQGAVCLLWRASATLAWGLAWTFRLAYNYWDSVA